MTSVLKKAIREKTLYEVLSAPPGATNEELHDAYLKLAFELHPDRFPEDVYTVAQGERFREITAAWGLLKDAKARRNYDQKLKLAGNQCTYCEGTGKRWTFAQRREGLCEFCKGTGQKLEER